MMQTMLTFTTDLFKNIVIYIRWCKPDALFQCTLTAFKDDIDFNSINTVTGAFPDFSVVKQWVEYIEPKDPHPENHTLYMELFDLYKRVYGHLKEDFVDLAKFRDQD